MLFVPIFYRQERKLMTYLPTQEHEFKKNFHLQNGTSGEVFCVAQDFLPNSDIAILKGEVGSAIF